MVIVYTTGYAGLQQKSETLPPWMGCGPAGCPLRGRALSKVRGRGIAPRIFAWTAFPYNLEGQEGGPPALTRLAGIGMFCLLVHAVAN